MSGRLERHAVQAACYAEMMKTLLSGPASVADLMKVSGLHLNTVRKAVNALRRRKVIYIAEWAKDAVGHQSVPCYTIGEQADRPRPPPLAKEITNRSYRQKRAALKTIQRMAGDCK